MADNQIQLAEHLQALLQNFAPVKRKKMIRTIAMALRKENQKRITRQQDPDGKKWTPRKPQAVQFKNNGIAKKKKMFLGLKKAGLFKINAKLDEADIGWSGKVGQIAYEHHHGEKVKNVQLPERLLLGADKNDYRIAEQIILDMINV